MTALLEVEGASKRFGGVSAVDALSFTVERGSFTAIIGPNGAGKTSAFNVITGAYALDSGDVRFEGRSIRGASPAAISRLGIARTFQTLQIFGAMTVLENVLIPLEARGTAAARDRALAYLDLVGLRDDAERVAAQLPFGRQRLLELARALGAEPRLLLLDEPTSGLSRAEVARFVDVLARLRTEGQTILMIEHDVPTVMAISTKIIVLHRGAKLAEGAPSEVQRDERVIEAYLGERDAAPKSRIAHTLGEVTLAVRDLVTMRGAVRALDGVQLAVRRGEIVAIIGANGAGKSTLLGTLAGWYPPASGSIALAGTDVSGMPAQRVVRAGLVLVPERRAMFEELSVLRNLELGGYAHGGPTAAEYERVFTLFPRLRERRAQRAGTLSGGEQQMVAIARGILARPAVLLLDEPSLGLAPRVVAENFTALERINADGTTIVLVEQNARAAFAIADRVAVLERGRITLEGTAAELGEDARIRQAYLG